MPADHCEQQPAGGLSCSSSAFAPLKHPPPHPSHPTQDLKTAQEQHRQKRRSMEEEQQKHFAVVSEVQHQEAAISECQVRGQPHRHTTATERQYACGDTPALSTCST